MHHLLATLLGGLFLFGVPHFLRYIPFCRDMCYSQRVFVLWLILALAFLGTGAAMLVWAIAKTLATGGHA